MFIKENNVQLSIDENIYKNVYTCFPFHFLHIYIDILFIFPTTGGKDLLFFLKG